MAITLADSFLNDLDELENEDDDVEAEDRLDGDEKEEKLDDAEDVPSSETTHDLRSVAKLRTSERYRAHLEAIESAEESAAAIVESNDILVKIEEEISNVHAFLRNVYSSKFPELETLVPQKMDYARVVRELRNETDMTAVDLNHVLPPTQVMVVSVTGSTTSGEKLEERALAAALEACEEMLALEKDKFRILEYLESRMSSLAPNVSKLVGASLAAMLVGVAGGLEKLAVIPACNLITLGQDKRRDLGGFGRVAQMPHTGILYFADLVQAAPAPLRRKVLKILSAKVSLAARVDAYGNSKKEDDVASGFVDDVKSKIEKLCEPPRAQKVKALPAPDVATGKRKRGGKRVRSAKEKVRVTEMRSLANKRAFANDFGNEYGDDAMGLDFGLLGANREGSGSLRAPAVDQKAGKSSKSQHQKAASRKPIQLSSGATNGLSSSLVFTPVQGIELANPTQQAQNVQAANEKWFSHTSGFQSALNARPSSSENNNTKLAFSSS